VAADPLLEVIGLHTQVRLRRRVLPVVQDLSFHVGAGETLGIVGESGCGKSMTALSVMRLVPRPVAQITAGQVKLDGTDLLTLPEPAMRRLRGSTLAMIFQEPMTSLNPVRTIGSQIIETIVLHQRLGRAAARDRAEEMLRLVHVPAARARLDDYPHHLSGGMRQRVMIAIALACSPRILLADEPTTALDVTIQAQVMAVLAELRARLGMAVVLITHDLGLVAENVDRVLVMYGGRKVEEAPVGALFADPRHPYTRGLLNSVPRMDTSGTASLARLREIRGTVPALDELPPGCPFAPRCPLASDICRREMPPIEAKAPGHLAACWHSDNVAGMAP
jgi:peptide/nickel transport system ATP-binding protein